MDDTSLAYLDAFLELPAALCAAATRLNRQIVSTAGGTIDFSRGTIPHITLYMGLFPVAELNRVKRELGAIAADTPPVRVAMQGIERAAEGYLFLNVRVDEPLQKLHERVVVALNPLRRGAIRQKYLDDLGRFTPGECDNIMKYGFPWLLELFRPHITIGKVDEAATEGVSRTLSAPGEREWATRLAFGEVGEHGTVVSVRSVFDLTKAS
ncbi:MAG TPA: 2'-5' RNA ligase family protein [Candidatus Ozemobacteraceae bacterium]|nr:2'-5' RNA ligase family protein [Candidatus Ozemobacteraceae bacterium]